jgi:phosphocarrier protein FPr
VQHDSKPIEVAANISDAPEVALALAFGADGVGLFRSEFLFMGRPAPPTEEEQFNAYRAAAQTLGGRALVIRTLDAGGDKPLPYLAPALEPNPYLGLRGIRYWLAHPALARPQLRALLRTNAQYPIKLLLPMVSTLDELQQARTLIDAVWAELRAEGITFANPLAIGIMVETPGAVMLAHQLARHVDFFSIGTNDLAQYMMVADRSNPRVAGLVNPLQPGVLLALQQVVQAAYAAGIGVSVCGELAGNPLATPLLVGLGVNQLSMNPPAIPPVRARLLRLDMRQAEELARRVLTMNSVDEVVCLLQENLELIE